ncbi:hypothetical protein RUND412_000230 [Rhizina undulata]
MAPPTFGNKRKWNIDMIRAEPPAFLFGGVVPLQPKAASEIGLPSPQLPMNETAEDPMDWESTGSPIVITACPPCTPKSPLQLLRDAEEEEEQQIILQGLLALGHAAGWRNWLHAPGGAGSAGDTVERVFNVGGHKVKVTIFLQ